MIQDSRQDSTVTRLRRAKRVVALTGAGISAESGIPTFRGEGGLWKNYRAEDLATPGAFARDPRLVWEWYDWRRQAISRCEPNPGHAVLARWESRFQTFTLVTQNVDGLHRRAGSRRVHYLHGDIWVVRCLGCGAETVDQRVPLPELPPRCPCGALLRPGVVWFGEGLPGSVMEAAAAAVEEAEVVLVIGTSGLVYPAAGLPARGRAAGAWVVEVNVAETPVSGVAHQVLAGPAGEILPRLDAEVFKP